MGGGLHVGFAVSAVPAHPSNMGHAWLLEKFEHWGPAGPLKLVTQKVATDLGERGDGLGDSSLCCWAGMI